MIVIGFLLFAALIFAWMVAPGGSPIRKPAAKSIVTATEVVVHA